MCVVPSWSAQVATVSTLLFPEQGQRQVTPTQVAQTTKLGADASTEDEATYPLGFGLTVPMANNGLLSTPPWNSPSTGDSDNSVAYHLKSFTKRVLKKVNSPLIRQPPKQPSPSKPALLKRSKRLEV